MQKVKYLMLSLGLVLISSIVGATEAGVAHSINSVVEVQQYNRAIHIMAMLLVGFGFLMVFVKNYGRSAITATFLMVAVAVPLYFLISDSGLFEGNRTEIEKLILAEFGAASLLIAAGALLGRLKMFQYIVLGLLFIPFYMFNEWMILENGLGVMSGSFADTGGSIVIHAFGAIFGIGATIGLAKKKYLEKNVEADATSDRFSLLGSMILWVFWPSFCAALVPVELIPYTVVNVFLALSGSTLATYVMSVSLRGKINAADIANAALAGGVAIGSTCDFANHTEAVIIGLVAGAVSTFGFAIIQSRQQKVFKAVDTCGVTNLHGIPGILGGLAAIPIVSGLDVGNQFVGIGLTIAVALLGGLISGKIISIFGERKEIYHDFAEFEDVEVEFEVYPRKRA
ncbi:MAG: ammonium transporter [Marinilabiliales bacterium]|nr:MAG: ammonium transporter [Marinilabiliales bacterium]